jgi:hypothetical protein
LDSRAFSYFDGARWSAAGDRRQGACAISDDLHHHDRNGPIVTILAGLLSIGPFGIGTLFAFAIPV